MMTSHHIRLSGLAVALVIGFAIPTVGALAQAGGGQADQAPAAKAEKHPGEKLYLRRTCIACHGRGGTGAIQDYPNIAGQSEAYMLRQVKDILAGKRTGSPDATGNPRAQGMKGALVTDQGEQRVSDEEIAQIISWLASEAPASPAAPETPIDPARLEQGAAAYKDAKCHTCHGPDGTKPTTKNYPFIAGQKRAYIVAQITDIRDGNRTNAQSKLMLNFVKKLDDETIGLIADYLSQIDRNAQ